VVPIFNPPPATRPCRADRIQAADDYLEARTGTYDQRCVRYDAAIEAMGAGGLCDFCTVVDVGSGWGECGARLHQTVPHDGSHFHRARYIPVDACIDGTDLETWNPPRDADWFVCLEVLEHLANPARLAYAMRAKATRGIVVSTPNPATTDVLGMDPTHKTPLPAAFFESLGFVVEERSFYGQPADSLFAVWRA
jgi:hypothetical protein